MTACSAASRRAGFSKRGFLAIVSYVSAAER